MDVYIWILGDPEMARKEFLKGQNRAEMEKKETQTGGFSFSKEVAPEMNLETATIRELSTKFMEACKQIDQTALNIQQFSAFLDSAEKAVLKSPAGSAMLKRILIDRTQDLRQRPRFGVRIMLSLITSVKTMSQRYPELEKFQFDEQKIKEEILPTYSREQREKTPEQKKLMSNVDGQITGVTFSLAQNSPMEDFYHTITRLMAAKRQEPDFRLKLLHANKNEKVNFIRFVEANKIHYPPPEVIFVMAGAVDEKNDGYDFWVRDGAVRRNDGTIVQPKNFYSPGLSDAYPNLVPMEGTDVRQSDLHFQGGNMRATENFLFIGSDDIRNTFNKGEQDWRNGAVEWPEMTDAQIQMTVAAFEREFGKKVIVIGDRRERRQGIFHIDMCVTPLDDKTVLVAQSLNGNDKEFLDATAKQLSDQGFSVVRIPYLRTTAFITYNNALIERYKNPDGSQAKKIYLPQYYAGSRQSPVYSLNGEIDLQRLNERAVEVYKSQGFEVVPIDVSARIIRLKGSINCLTFEDRKP
ncbi:hypothetical protein HY213_04070 [Candidatus Peregrinibacteria bacterium]|nr:hypothetical protein [Candidatus Peregrinibacteria bacterium]